MQNCILKHIDKIESAYYNQSIKILDILIFQQTGGNRMEIAMAVLKFIGGVIPLVQELLKALM
ncbi:MULTISPECIES: hypothetical protein [unclassified Bacillus (in: firmicutes)]|uniref:hypothetical protein n=1 Tax=unclassified Bacillus (in: firmicutes) TaxID=185979 RepID=UPI002814E288|nr:MULTISPECIES: hypothetical protein [unclassified Bacillus (in: firmicutes)]